MFDDKSNQQTEFASRFQTIVGRNLVLHLVPPIAICIISIILFVVCFQSEFNLQLSIFSAILALVHGGVVVRFCFRTYSNNTIAFTNFAACICYLSLLTYSFTLTPEIERGRGIALVILGAALVLVTPRLFALFALIASVTALIAFQQTGLGITGRDVLYVCLIPSIIGYSTCVSKKNLFLHLDKLFEEKKEDRVRLQAALTEAREELRLRKEIDGKLAIANQAFDRLIDVIPQVHWVRKENEIVFISPSYEDVWESKCDDLYANPATFMQKLHPEDGLILQTEFENCFQGGAFDQEYRLVMSDGRIKWIHARSYIDPDDFSTEFGVADDVTKKKEIEKAILQKNIELQQSIKSLQSETSLRRKIEAENAAIQEKLSHSQRLESLSLLAGGIAHDFNNILMAILINVDLLKLDIEQNMHPNVQRIEDIEKASTRAADICKQMLQFSGRIPTELQKVNLADQCSDAIQILHSIVPQNVTVEFTQPESPAFTLGTPAQVQQVVLNLLTNAIEAIDDFGTIQISLSTGYFNSSKLESSYLDAPNADSNFHVISCKDNGCGMEKLTLKRLFDPFYSSKSHGRGLGLASVLGIVKGHGGTITVDSSIGAGTEFRVYLPAYDGDSDQLTGKEASSYVSQVLT